MGKMGSADRGPEEGKDGVLVAQRDEGQKDWETITARERVRNSYLKLLRRMAPNRASRVMVPVSRPRRR